MLQSNKIKDLNKAVDEVQKAMGTSADVKHINNALKMVTTHHVSCAADPFGGAERFGLLCVGGRVNAVLFVVSWVVNRDPKVAQAL